MLYCWNIGSWSAQAQSSTSKLFNTKFAQTICSIDIISNVPPPTDARFIEKPTKLVKVTLFSQIPLRYPRLWDLQQTQAQISKCQYTFQLFTHQHNVPFSENVNGDIWLEVNFLWTAHREWRQSNIPHRHYVFVLYHVYFTVPLDCAQCDEALKIFDESENRWKPKAIRPRTFKHTLSSVQLMFQNHVRRMKCELKMKITEGSTCSCQITTDWKCDQKKFILNFVGKIHLIAHM